MYAGLVTWRMRSQQAYTPVLEDWTFHAVFPVMAYLALAVSGVWAPSRAHAALFAVGGATLLLLFSAIHNASDAVTYHVWVNLRNAKD